ncbi:efflux RND transporter periplasmic adaptor subunit [Lutimaribacter marinistellae]|uniref:Efflux RND transporter periplasmic adaptor subunit n=1 Tax=Lutimaribacter marinistellae TaxID=1820329 RepID=A0ABV7TDQ3_9RHOB
MQTKILRIIAANTLCSMALSFSPVVAEEKRAVGVEPLLFEGVVRPNREAELSPLVDNAVTEIHFRAGQYVEEGDLLFEFGKRAPAIELRLAETALKDAKAQLRLVEADLQRKSQLFLKELISDAELQFIQAQRDISEVAVERAELIYDGAELAYGFTEIRAPFSGVISEPFVKLFKYLDTGRNRDQTLAFLADIDPVHVVVIVPYEQFLARRSILATDEEGFAALELSLLLPNGDDYPHKGRYFGGAFSIDEETQTLEVLAEFPNPDLVLRPGAKVTVVSRFVE